MVVVSALISPNSDVQVTLATAASVFTAELQAMLLAVNTYNLSHRPQITD